VTRSPITFYTTPLSTLLPLIKRPTTHLLYECVWPFGEQDGGLWLVYRSTHGLGPFLLVEPDPLVRLHQVGQGLALRFMKEEERG
jgi:hypothetical protein